MNFARDDFATIHRRKKLAAWLSTLRGPAKQKPDYDALINASIESLMRAQALNEAAMYRQMIPHNIYPMASGISALGLFGGWPR